MLLIRDYICVEISDIIMNVFLLSEDFWDDGQLSDLVLVIIDIVDDGEFDVCFFVFFVMERISFCKLKFIKIIVFVVIIVVLIIICIVLLVLLIWSGKLFFGVKEEVVCVIEGCIDVVYYMFYFMN